MGSIPIALPRVGGGRVNKPRRWPNPLGGQNGSVAYPSRIAAHEGTGTPERPSQLAPLDGARGAVPRVFSYTDNPWNWAVPASRRNATPMGYRFARYIRQMVPNTAAIRNFAMQDARTVWTTNRPDNPTQTPASPVPFSRHRVTQTFVAPYDTRTNTVYAPRAIVQRPQAARKVVAGPAVGRRMVAPWMFNLSRLAPTTTYGDTTAVLAPPTAPAGGHAQPGPGPALRAAARVANVRGG